MNSAGVWGSSTGQPGISAYESYRKITIGNGEEPLDEAAWVESIQGGEGAAIQAVDVIGNGQLQVTMSDGSQMIADGYVRPTVDMEGSTIRWSYDGGETWMEGNDVRGPRGETGIQGPVGPKGERGSDGVNGKDGQPGKDGIVPVYSVTGELWKGVVTRQYVTTVDGDGQWSVDYSGAGFKDNPIIHATPWYSGTSAADQCVISYASRSVNGVSGRAVRGVSGSLLGLSSTWRFVPSGTTINVSVTGPTA